MPTDTLQWPRRQSVELARTTTWPIRGATATDRTHTRCEAAAYNTSRTARDHRTRSASRSHLTFASVSQRTISNGRALDSEYGRSRDRHDWRRGQYFCACPLHIASDALRVCTTARVGNAPVLRVSSFRDADDCRGPVWSCVRVLHLRAIVRAVFPMSTLPRSCN